MFRIRLSPTLGLVGLVLGDRARLEFIDLVLGIRIRFRVKAQLKLGLVSS